MIYSMTGYGKSRSSKNNISVEVEVKSINSRFFEVSLKLPAVLSQYDYELREFIKTKVQRGKISVIIHFKKNGIENGVSIDQEKLAAHLSLIRKVKKIAGIKEEIKLEHIIGNKELFSAQDNDLTKAEFELIKNTLNKAFDKLLQMKKKEGAELSKDFLIRIETINKRVSEIEKEFKRNIDDYFAKLKERIKDLVENPELNEDRLNLELALIADRADITEECVRLQSHLKFFKESLKTEKEPGKKLNFLCQEMNRETNTISSKSVATSIIHTSVLIKEEIEKIREQLQNIE